LGNYLFAQDEAIIGPDKDAFSLAGVASFKGISNQNVLPEATSEVTPI
jgi:hypothetical protein